MKFTLHVFDLIFISGGGGGGGVEGKTAAKPVAFVSVKPADIFEEGCQRFNNSEHDTTGYFCLNLGTTSTVFLAANTAYIWQEVRIFPAVFVTAK